MMQVPSTFGLAVFAAMAFGMRCGAHSLDARRIVETMEAHYEALVATADREGTEERPVPYSWHDGRVHFVEPENWCSGFFSGTLWKLYEATGKSAWRSAALRHTRKLERIRHFNEHHDVGFMLMSSYGNAWRLTGENEFAEVLRDGARALASRYRVKAGLIQSWGLWSFEWHCPVIIDNMMNLELLEWASDNAARNDYTDGVVFDEIARAHADATDRNHFRADGSAYHLIDYDPTTGNVLRRFAGQGYDSERGVWSRGQAWAVYGFAMMYRETHDPRYLDRACRSADWALAAPDMPADRIACWDYFAPGRHDAPRDAAGAAVLAAGLVELSNHVVEHRRNAYLAEARTILEALSSSAYFADRDENGGFAIKHCVGSYPANSQVDVPLNYADYYYLEAVMRYQAALVRPKVILDADVSKGADDVAALAVLHALADRGECEILGAFVESTGPFAVGVFEAVNSAYGRVLLSVGRPQGQAEEGEDAAAYKDVVSRYSKTIVHQRSDSAPEAVSTYRRLLAGQDDGAVTICSLGSGHNLSALLASGPDAYSPLDGRVLVARKVRNLIVPAQENGGGCRYVQDGWPANVLMLPTEEPGRVLRNVVYGHRGKTPVRDLVAADDTYSDEKGRTVLLAIRGTVGGDLHVAVDQLMRRKPRK